MTGKNNDELFRIVMPMEVGNYIFINPADSLHQVRRSPSTLKKPVQVLTAAEKDQEAMEFTSFPILYRYKSGISTPSKSITMHVFSCLLSSLH
jgi:hypothetical protein